MPTNEWKNLYDARGNNIAKIKKYVHDTNQKQHIIHFEFSLSFERAKDPVEVTMKSPYIEVIFDGKNLKVTVLSSYSHPTFGVCGGIGACDKCGIHNHRILYAPSEVCFTMIPVLDCGSTCNPTTKILQEVGFTW